MDRLISFFPHFTTQGNWPIQLEVRYREEPNTPCLGFISITFLWGIGESASIRRNSQQLHWGVLQNLTMTARSTPKKYCQHVGTCMRLESDRARPSKSNKDSLRFFRYKFRRSLREATPAKLHAILHTYKLATLQHISINS